MAPVSRQKLLTPPTLTETPVNNTYEPGFLAGVLTAGIHSEARPVGPPTPPSHGTSVISDRQVQLLQERGISRVVVQALQKGVHFRKDQTAVTLGISSV